MFKIDNFTFGSITINGEIFNSDLMLLPDKVINDWWRQEGHSLHPEDLKSILEYRPEVIIVGCGDSGALKVPDKTREFIRNKNILLIEKNTPEACREYNRLATSGKKVAACLHLTC